MYNRYNIRNTSREMEILMSSKEFLMEEKRKTMDMFDYSKYLKNTTNIRYDYDEKENLHRRDLNYKNILYMYEGNENDNKRTYICLRRASVMKNNNGLDIYQHTNVINLLSPVLISHELINKCEKVDDLFKLCKVEYNQELRPLEYTIIAEMYKDKIIFISGEELEIRKGLFDRDNIKLINIEDKLIEWKKLFDSDKYNEDLLDVFGKGLALVQARNFYGLEEKNKTKEKKIIDQYKNDIITDYVKTNSNELYHDKKELNTENIIDNILSLEWDGNSDEKVINMNTLEAVVKEITEDKSYHENIKNNDIEILKIKDLSYSIIEKINSDTNKIEMRLEVEEMIDYILKNLNGGTKTC